jgi:hypothetical protein
MDTLPVTNKTVGEPESVTNKTLETGASLVQVSVYIPCISVHADGS